MSEQDDNPEARLMTKLAPIIGALAQRGTVATAITIARDNQRPSGVIHFTVMATYRPGEQNLHLEANWLGAKLLLSRFHLHDPREAPLPNSIEVFAAISIDDLCGTSSHKTGTTDRTLN